MRFSVEVPENIVTQLHLDGPDGQRRALEMLALEGCRRGDLSRGQVSELLSLEFNETERFLKDYGCGHSLTSAEYENELRSLREFLGR